jgi:hypothetical protein
MIWFNIVFLGNAYCFFLHSEESTGLFIVGVAHCVRKVPLRDFYVPLKRYYKAYQIEKYPFVALTCGITSIQNFSNIFPFILFLEIYFTRVQQHIFRKHVINNNKLLISLSLIAIAYWRARVMQLSIIDVVTVRYLQGITST